MIESPNGITRRGVAAAAARGAEGDVSTAAAAPGHAAPMPRAAVSAAARGAQYFFICVPHWVRVSGWGVNEPPVRVGVPEVYIGQRGVKSWLVPGAFLHGHWSSCRPGSLLPP
ncbi:hypothetical protein RKD19_000489 [Streptomyces canus]